LDLYLINKKERDRLLALDQDASAVMYRMRKLANQAAESIDLKATDECTSALTTILMHQGIIRTSKYEAATCDLAALRSSIAEDPKGLLDFQVKRRFLVDV